MGQDARTIITNDPILSSIKEKATQVASSKANLVIEGPGGAGKQLLGEFIHFNSMRASQEIHYMSGTAPTEMNHIFQRASGSTLIVDDIHALEAKFQINLLSLLQSQKSDVRVIALTTESLKQFVQQRKFREDLFYLLNVIHFDIPALKDRKGDIEPLCEYFCETYAKRNGTDVPRMDASALQKLRSHGWAGNVRELENAIERALVSTASGENPRLQLTASDFHLEEADSVRVADKQYLRRLPDGWVGRELADIERELIYWTLQRTNGNRTHAARMLGISIRTLRNKLSLYRSMEDGLFQNI
jgi:DNA-binding NtrC family response regulator